MNKATKRAWIKALRSGKYEQGQGFLCSDNKYCCLGVLYDIAIDEYWYRNSFPKSENTWGTEAGTIATIYPYLAALGLTADDHTALISMNDQGSSFAEIADYIENNL